MEKYKNYSLIHDNEDGKNWQRRADRFSLYFKHNISQWLPADKGSKILEIGCGRGYLLNYLRQRGYVSTYGIDACFESIDTARQRSLECEFVDVFEYLANNDKQWDCIILIEVVEHFTKEEAIKLIKLIHTKLRPEGRVIFKTDNGYNLMAYSALCYDITHEYLFTEQSMMQLFVRAGFGLEGIEIKKSFNWVFWKNPLNYIGLCVESVMNLFTKLLHRLYGRNTSTIFTKSILAKAVR